MKKLLFVLISFILFVGCVNAEVTTFDRKTVPNYGVNKHWNINDNNLDNVLRTHLVDINDKIYDFSDILTPEEEIYLKRLIDDFISTTDMDLVILTEEFYNTTDEENEDYAVDFYDYNDFGMKHDNFYSGVIIFRNSHPTMPYYGVYTFGEAQYYYPLSTRLDYTLDDVYNDMVSHNYQDAMADIINDLKYYYNQGKDSYVSDYELDEDGFLVIPFEIPWFWALAISAVVTTIIIVVNVNKNKMVRPELFAADYLDEGSIRYTDSHDYFLTSKTTSYRMSSSSGGGGGSSFGGSRGGSSGGGHGGGGRRG